jgi:hypothetical protein
MYCHRGTRGGCLGAVSQNKIISVTIKKLHEVDRYAGRVFMEDGGNILFAYLGLE